MKHTTVINLFGGPGTGKSTLAAELFTKMKRAGLSCELVREYVKDWAWEGRQVRLYDQLYFLGEQSRRESLLYNKVNYVITDSPILLSGFYGEFYTGVANKYISDAAIAFCDLAGAHGVSYRNFFLKRNKPYVSEGRYETEEKAKGIDVTMREYLKNIGMQFAGIDCDDDQKADAILKSLLHY